MRILLVTLHENLPFAITKVLNPANEYCAIVTDEVEPAKQFIKSVGGSESMVYPFYELKECIENFYFDIVLCISDGRTASSIHEYLKEHGVSMDKFFNVYLANDSNNPFLLDRAMRYYKLHHTEFDMFGTGISLISDCLDSSQFKRKLFNFARGSQDLYYDYQMAKYVINVSGGGGIEYALIGLAPYIFHCDESKSYAVRYRLMQYLISLNDLHNFSIHADECRKWFRKEFLSIKLPLDNFDVNKVFFTRSSNSVMNFYFRMHSRAKIDGWQRKDHIETVAENIKILDDYLTLCEQNNIRPIMFVPIMSEGYMKYFSRKKLEEFYYLVRQAQRKHSSAVFVDGWKFPGFSDADFYDVEHLNIKGAAKFSAILNNIIENLEMG